MTSAPVPQPESSPTESCAAPDFIQPHDLKRFRRLLDRTLGVCFKLSVIEVPEPRERQTVLKWLRPQFAEKQVVEHDVDLVQLLGPRAEWSGGSTNVWAALFDAIPPASVPGHHAVFVVWGFEELMDHTGQENWDIVRQFNIQRDLFVRDYPCWWVLLLHPASRQHWLKNAPDFSDFVALWIEAPLRAVVHEDVGVRDRVTSLHVESASSSDRADWPEPLRLAREDIRIRRREGQIRMLPDARQLLGDLMRRQY